MARTAIDRTGRVYGRLTAIREAGRTPDKAVLWLCRCECGKEVVVRGNSLQAGSSRSCGCLVKDTRSSPAMDLTGTVYGRLTAIEPTDGRIAAGSVIWLCRCECGNEVMVPTNRLRSGNTRSCGCLFADSHFRKHGMSYSVEYKTWQAMKSRCQDSNNGRFSDYGGRGITVCERWLESFENFFEDMGLRPGKGYSIERRDNDAGYSPENCHWATDVEQRANQRARTTNAETDVLKAEVAALRAEIDRLRASA